MGAPSEWPDGPLVDETGGAITRVAAAEWWVFLAACAAREVIDGLAAGAVKDGTRT
jgi:hypothetical protein